MPYKSSGGFPIERASKLGHIKFIQEPRIQRLLEAFERTDDAHDGAGFGTLSGHIDLDAGGLRNTVAIDGSHASIPNVVATHKRIAFISAAAVRLSRATVAAMKADPIQDPRSLSVLMRDNTLTLPATLPLAGIAVPGETVADTIRWTVDETLRYTQLYETLNFLVSRLWLDEYEMQEHMACLSCGDEFILPRGELSFRCPACQHRHTLSDYLQLITTPPEDWATEEAAIGLRNVMETLLLFSLIVEYRDHPFVLKTTLFVKDGPLLLRAALSRLIEPIRAFLAHLHRQGREVHLVGIEKTGALVDHTPLIASVLKEPGDYFLPSVRYLHERIQGVPFVEATYRNRVQYGSKIVIRLGPNHVIACNVPTGEFLLEPSESDLYGLQESMGLLGELLSYSYENALVPIVLANQHASIAFQPASAILADFASRVLE